MSVEIMSSKYDTQAVLICSGTDTAFGPVIGEQPEHDMGALDTAIHFLEWLVTDARVVENLDSRWIDYQEALPEILAHAENDQIDEDAEDDAEWDRVEAQWAIDHPESEATV